jgi:predicted RNA-binding protein YlqC (UPF0109 family)
MEHLAKSLVDAPDQVTVDVEDDDRGTTLALTVAESDLGKVIGKSGRTARCLRVILAAAGMKANQRYQLEIVE